MTTVTWLDRHIVMGAPLPQHHAATEAGQTFALVRERVDGRGWRVSVYRDGNPAHAQEAIAGSERQAKRWIERWAAHRSISYPVVPRKKLPHLPVRVVPAIVPRAVATFTDQERALMVRLPGVSGAAHQRHLRRYT